jgi:hypothetical protein
MRFVNALRCLEAEAVLDKIILISAASLRLLGLRVYTRFIDFLATSRYYDAKSVELQFSPRYTLEPIPLQLAGFSMRLGTVNGDLCSFRHLIQPYNVYDEVQFTIDDHNTSIKIRPHNYVRKDSEEAIERLIQRSNELYWQELYSYHKQIEAIDLGLHHENLKTERSQYLDLE